MATSVTGTAGNGSTLTSSIPVLIGGVDSGGVVRTLVLASDGSIPVKTRDQLSSTATGLLTRNANLMALSSAGTAPATQVVFGVLFGLRAGDTVTGIALANSVAAAGTAPTTARFGLADSTGKILVLSANVGAAASWGQGMCQFAFTAPYAITADGGYFGCFVVNGTWSVTQPTPLRGGNALSAGTFSLAGAVPYAFAQTGQTDLPALGASSTITSVASLQNYWMGLY